jgi:hypothetical protein
MYIQQEATLHSLLYLEAALHISGGTTTHHQEHINCIYSIWYLSHRYCYLPLSWKSWDVKFIGHTLSTEQLVVTLGQFHKDQEKFIVVELKFRG